MKWKPYVLDLQDIGNGVAKLDSSKYLKDIQ